jgi:PP-loop superfamily ATP-utilizing enzyme
MEIKAEDAERLMNDEVFQNALGLLRSRALEDLAVTNPHDTEKMMAHQSMVQIIDELRTHLATLINIRQLEDDVNGAPV